MTPESCLGPGVGGITPGRALDLGAGEGRTALWLAAKGWTVTAVDFSDVAIERGQQRAAVAGVATAIDWVCQNLLGMRIERAERLRVGDAAMPSSAPSRSDRHRVAACPTVWRRGESDTT